MTPGTYLRLCRDRAGRTLEDVALWTDTWPTAVSARARAELLGLVEQDLMPVHAGLVDALQAAQGHGLYAFDPHVLWQLVAIHAGATIGAPDVCRSCGCSWSDPCIDAGGASCGWLDGTAIKCTACATIGELAAAAPAEEPDVLPRRAAA